MMAMTRAQLAKRLITLAAKKPEAPTEAEDLGTYEADIPKGLCATCSASDKQQKSRKRKAASQ
jgi:hypothetical protein